MRPEYLSSGEPSRLIPAVSETNKEMRLLSPVLSALQLVPLYAKEVLEPFGIRVGKRTRITCFSEVVFTNEDERIRPDGLIVIDTGRTQWRALVEAKHGSAHLGFDQICSYLELAKRHAVDAVITISNQFAASPRHSPLQIPARLTKRVALFHSSWSSIRTNIELLEASGLIEDAEQALVLAELKRFLTHDSSGIVGFHKMSGGWKDTVRTLATGGNVAKNDEAAQAIAHDWMQEQRDLCLILSRRVQRPVVLRLPRKHLDSKDDWHRSVVDDLTTHRHLTCIVEVPDAATQIELDADVASRMVAVSMKLKAPRDKKRTPARVNWVVRQLAKVDDPRVCLRVHWPGRKPHKDLLLTDLQKGPSILKEVDDNTACNYVEVRLNTDLAGRFSGSKTFIEDVEASFVAFYELVGQNLRAWQAPAPKTVVEPTGEESGTDEVGQAFDLPRKKRVPENLW